MVEGHLLSRKLGKLLGDAVAGVRSPEAQKPGQRLPCRDHIGVAPDKVYPDLLVERLLVREVKLADVACCVLPLSQIESRVARLQNRAPHGRYLLHCRHAVERHLDLVGHTEDGIADSSFGCSKLRRCDPPPCGQKEDAQEVLAHGKAEARLRGACHGECYAGSEDRVLQETRLDEVRLGDREILVDRL